MLEADGHSSSQLSRTKWGHSGAQAPPFPGTARRVSPQCTLQAAEDPPDQVTVDPGLGRRSRREFMEHDEGLIVGELKTKELYSYFCQNNYLTEEELARYA